MMQNLTVVSSTVCAHVGCPKNLGLGLTPWDGGVADALETRYSPTYVIIQKFVALCQTIWAYVEGPKIGDAWAPPP